MKLGHPNKWCLVTIALALSFVSANALSIKREPVTEQVLIITTPDPQFQDETEANLATGATESEQRDEATTVDSVILQDSTGESWEVDPTSSSILSKDVEIEIATSVPAKNRLMADQPVESSKPILPEIYSFRIESDIKYRYSRTYVTSRVANKDPTRAQEVTFSVVLPETAFISKFIMEIDGKPYEAYVKEKEEAKKDYIQAQSQGQSAGLVEKSTRNSNVFNVNVNVKPQTKVTFNLTYEELLTRRLGRYEQAININPDQVSSIKDYQILVNIEESRNLTLVRVPSLSNDIDAQEDAEGNNKDAVIERPAPNKAKISWSPSTADQKKLVKEGISGKFAVQYDIDRDSDAGQILVMQGYFVHFFAPENLPPLRKHVVFILDISGSMWGRKMEQLKESQKKILDDLSSDDFFNIITFSSDVYLWSPEDSLNKNDNNDRFYSYTAAPVSPQLLAKRQPLPATPANILKAKEFIDSLVASGGTNIHDAIIEALNLTAAIKNDQEKASNPSTEAEAMAIETTLPGTPSTTVATTTTSAASSTSGSGSSSSTTTTSTEAAPSSTTDVDEEADDEDRTVSIVDIAKSGLSDIMTEIPETTTLSSSGRVILPPNVQSLIMFLTDGEPTVGVTDPPEIQKLIQAANRNLSIPIFSLGFGEGADFPFLKKLSLQNNGFGRKIYEASDASLQLQGFYNEIASPLLSNVKFNYTSPDYNVTDITVTSFSTIFGGTEIAVAGKLVAPPKPERDDVVESTTATETIAPSNDAQPTTELSVEDATPGLDTFDSPNRPLELSIACDFKPSENYFFDVTIEGNGRDGEVEFQDVEVLERRRSCIDIPIPFFPDRIFPPRPTPPPTPEDQFLERLWAYLTIQQLIEKDLAQLDTKSGDADPSENSIDATPAATPGDSSVETTVLPVGPETPVETSVVRNVSKTETLKERALRLALKYGFVTPLTSLVVVKPNSSDVTNAVPTDARPDAADSFYAARRISFQAPILPATQIRMAPPPAMHPLSITSAYKSRVRGISRPLNYPSPRMNYGAYSFPSAHNSLIDPLNSLQMDPQYSAELSAPQSMPMLTALSAPAYIKSANIGALHNRIAAHPFPIHAHFQSRPVPPIPFQAGPPGGNYQSTPLSLGFVPHFGGASYESSDDYDPSPVAPFSTAPTLLPLPTTSAPPRTTSSEPETTTQSRQLSLDDITWITPNEFYLNINETIYRIARNETVQDAGVGYECTREEDQGQCSHLRDCVLPAFVSSEVTFKTSYFCPIDSNSPTTNAYVGVCCPSRRGRTVAEEP